MASDLCLKKWFRAYTATPGKGKEWGMKVNLKFKREPA